MSPSTLTKQRQKYTSGIIISSTLGLGIGYYYFCYLDTVVASASTLLLLLLFCYTVLANMRARLPVNGVEPLRY